MSEPSAPLDEIRAARALETALYEWQNLGAPAFDVVKAIANLIAALVVPSLPSGNGGTKCGK